MAFTPLFQEIDEVLTTATSRDLAQKIIDHISNNYQELQKLFFDEEFRFFGFPHVATLPDMNGGHAMFDSMYSLGQSLISVGYEKDIQVKIWQNNGVISAKNLNLADKNYTAQINARMSTSGNTLVNGVYVPNGSIEVMPPLKFD